MELRQLETRFAYKDPTRGLSLRLWELHAKYMRRAIYSLRSFSDSARLSSLPGLTGSLVPRRR